MNMSDIKIEAKRVALYDGAKKSIEYFSKLVTKYYVHINKFKKIKESNNRLKRQNELLFTQVNNTRKILKRLNINPDNFLDSIVNDEGSEPRNGFRGPLITKL